jgi:hypothetical protein
MDFLDEGSNLIIKTEQQRNLNITTIDGASSPIS